MKIPQKQSWQWLAMVCSGLHWFDQPPQTIANNRKQRPTARRAHGYTLIEVLAAAAIISIGTTAMVSLSSTLMLQEELANRVSVTRNYQENHSAALAARPVHGADHRADASPQSERHSTAGTLQQPDAGRKRPQPPSMA